MKLTVLAVALLAPVAASATTLVDGGFEAKGAATPVTAYCYDGFSAGGNAPCAASPWTGSGVVLSGNGAWGGTTTPFGAYFAIVQGTQSLAQSFVATATNSLALSWYDANRTNNGGTQSYTVTVTHGADVVDLGTFSGVGGQFNLKTATFQAVAGESYTLSFTGLSNEDRTAFIDNVGLAVVPEPATWGLMLAGFGLVGAAARRRRTAVAA